MSTTSRKRKPAHTPPKRLEKRQRKKKKTFKKRLSTLLPGKQPLLLISSSFTPKTSHSGLKNKGTLRFPATKNLLSARKLLQPQVSPLSVVPFPRQKCSSSRLPCWRFVHSSWQKLEHGNCERSKSWLAVSRFAKKPPFPEKYQEIHGMFSAQAYPLKSGKAILTMPSKPPTG